MSVDARDRDSSTERWKVSWRWCGGQRPERTKGLGETLQDSSPPLPSLSPARGHHGSGLSDGPSPSWLSHPRDEVFSPRPHPDSRPPFTSSPQSAGRPGLHRSPMFESDSDQHQNPSSDESEKNGMDFYS
ncbi:hypothetical protein J4Q44_G00348230 [Coregonus suidteri]|uniref:Uncharacterized protein n=1 Tax=Coregonus suidteri TaxID=861788 RepID=A0AAN8KM01_9TELE